MLINPFGVQAGRFIMDTNPIACMMGPVGSAKTTASCKKLGKIAFAQAPGPDGVRRSRFVIVRNTTPQLKDTTIKSWLQNFPEAQFGKFEHTNKVQRWRFTPKGEKHPIDAEFLFRALDDEKDVANVLGMEVTGFWFNELREIDPGLFGHIRARIGRYPGAAMGGCTWAGWIADTNPWPFTSEYHEWFVTNPKPGYAFFHQPGGMDPKAENLANLNQTAETLKLPWNDPVRQAQGRQYYVNLLGDYTRADADMFVHSKFGASRSGKPVYQEYDDNVHIETFELDPNASLYIGYDCTGRTPAAVVSQKTAEGQWRVAYEFCVDGMGMQQHAEELKRFLLEEIPGLKVKKITCDPAGRAKDSGEIDMLQIIRNSFKGSVVMAARTNDPATRVAAVSGLLRRLINGKPAIIVHPRCKLLRQGFISEYHYRKMKVSGKERYTEDAEKNHPFADLHDALQYQMLGGGEGRAQTGSGDGDWSTRGAITPRKVWSPYDVST